MTKDLFARFPVADHPTTPLSALVALERRQFGILLRYAERVLLLDALGEASGHLRERLRAMIQLLSEALSPESPDYGKAHQAVLVLDHALLDECDLATQCAPSQRVVVHGLVAVTEAFLETVEIMAALLPMRPHTPEKKSIDLGPLRESLVALTDAIALEADHLPPEGLAIHEALLACRTTLGDGEHVSEEEVSIIVRALVHRLGQMLFGSAGTKLYLLIRTTLEHATALRTVLPSGDPLLRPSAQVTARAEGRFAASLDAATSSGQRGAVGALMAELEEAKKRRVLLAKKDDLAEADRDAIDVAKNVERHVLARLRMQGGPDYELEAKIAQEWEEKSGIRYNVHPDEFPGSDYGEDQVEDEDDEDEPSSIYKVDEFEFHVHEKTVVIVNTQLREDGDAHEGVIGCVSLSALQRFVAQLAESEIPTWAHKVEVILAGHHNLVVTRWEKSASAESGWIVWARLIDKAAPIPGFKPYTRTHGTVRLGAPIETITVYLLEAP